MISDGTNYSSPAARIYNRPAVLHVVHNFSGHGGVQEHVRDLCSGLSAEFEPLVVSPEAGVITLYGRDCAILRRYPGAELDWPVVPARSEPHDSALTTIIEEFKPAVIHVHHLSGWPLGMLNLISQCAVPWTITFHDYVAITPHGGMIGAAEPQWTFTADYTTAVYGRDISDFCSARRDFIAESLVRAALKIAPSAYAAGVIGQIFSGGCRIVEHGIRALPASFTRCQSGSGRALRFGYCGTMIPQKGWHLLHEAFLRCGHKLAEAELHFFGGVPDDPRFEAAQIHFHPPYERQNFPDILSSIDVGIIPSVFAETYCLVLSEFWQAGIPAAASRIGALGERVQDGQNGRLFAPGDVAGIAETLDWFYQDRSWKNWQLPAPRSIDQMLAEYREIYSGLARLPAK